MKFEAEKEEYDVILKRWLWSDRRISRYAFIQDIKLFYMHKKIKEGTLVRKCDVRKSYNDMLVHFDKVFRAIIMPETQIDNMVNKKEDEIRKVLNRQTNLVILELGYGELPFEYNKVVRELFQNEIKKNIELDFSSNDEYKNKIIEILETDEDTIRVCLSEIINTCQYKIVIIFLTICNDIAGLPKRDRKAIYEDKRRFERCKKRTISGLKELGRPYADVENKEYENKEEFGSCNYEKSLSHYKEMLSTNLMHTCNVTAKKSKAISDILEYL
jgi:hypothetical protein